MIKVAVIDYGVGNLLSVSRAFEHCGATVMVTSDPTLILNAQRVVLPGVGAFSSGMEALKARGLTEVVHEVVSRGIPLIGICLGMQMLMDASEEFGETKGLGLIPGRVISIPPMDSSNRPLKIPHIGWNELYPAKSSSWTNTFLSGLSHGDAAYFVHSFMAQPTNSTHRIADCLYGEHEICAAIQHENVSGCQFHPEKSGRVGLSIIHAFLDTAGSTSRDECKSLGVPS